ncbi:histidinol dehydrogenase (HDH) [Treponema primitia ZAS-2]|uniref:Histidinol dehydrogenase (HDH) n=1 Tax=Treponema primitia (strain ATCC BAA-887 / DSM 12427 / ZAS-2) TaxID=545694 RepID=F5YL09_TREPZ|nr:histidinol dehydrogenase [Treponema primitia]AEF83754.1 histidinol dehydrogenase (HDH) [Treponema primitia ZAS-2]
MRILVSADFDSYWEGLSVPVTDEGVSAAVREVIAGVRKDGDAAVRSYAARFDRSSPETLEVPMSALKAAWENLRAEEPELAAALELAAGHIRRFAEKQKAQFGDFEYEMSPGLFTGQRVIPVQRAAIYVPSGRFPLISTVLMGAIPAVVAGVPEVMAVSAPLEDGLPDRRILAAAYIAGLHRVFAIGGAQAIAALALGTKTVPRVDIIAGPGNKYVAAAKRLLFGEVGIDFVAGPTDVLIIADDTADVPRTGVSGASSAIAVTDAADLAAADMLAQAEHDPDARARVLVPNRDFADRVAVALEKRLAVLPTAETARASLDAGGLIIVYETKDEALRIANTIAPEHLELQVANPESWVPALKNYGSLFIGDMAAEVLGDYSAGINHTLPTSGSARFSGGLSVRHFLKTVTTLRCEKGSGFEEARLAAECIAQAEGLIAHRESAAARSKPLTPGSIENHRSREGGALVYPVYSRRSRGLSVGINLFPDEKICTFDCPYCEVFPFKTDISFSVPLMEQTLREVLSQAHSQSIEVKDICFSGNGEPTISPHFPAALEAALRIRDELVPWAALVVITNATGLLNDRIFELLRSAAAGKAALRIWLKLDAGTEAWYSRMDQSSVPFDSLRARIREFAALAPFTVQTMICAIDGAPPSAEEATAWERLVLDLAGGGKIRSVQIYGKARPSPGDPQASQLPLSFLEERAASLRTALGGSGRDAIPVEVFP